jgi:FtsH-binding integral membrane protein
MNYQNDIIDSDIAQRQAISRTFTGRVMTYMAAAIAISGVIAYLFGTNTGLLSYMVDFETGSLKTLAWISIFAPFGLVLLMSAGINKMSAPTMLLVFIAFAALMGLSLSTIFLVYSLGSIYLTFFVTAITFGIMAVLGYYTQTDLTKFGGILRMALIGLIVAMVVNMFMGSPMMDYVISMIGVLIFTGLTAYDMQKIRQLGMQIEAGTEGESKMALLGALTLYLDFINLFLFLLRFLGNRD